jgi:hypothetical protein
MFRELINHAKAAAGSLVARYFARASVAVPFVVALGFATAAVTITLVERYGHVAAYWLVAVGFTVIGLLAALIVSVKEQEEKRAEQQAEERDTAETGADAAAQAAVQLPVAALGALLSSPGGATAALGGAKLLGRNLPLVALIVLIGMLLLPSEAAAEAEEAGSEPRKPNGMHPPAGLEPIHGAA